MEQRCLRLLIALALLLPTGAFAAQSRTDPALEPLARALKGFITAVKAEDAKAVANCLHASGDPQGELRNAQAARIVGSYRLYKTLVEKLDDEAALDVTEGAGLVVPGDLFSLLLGDWTLKHDVATAKPGETDEVIGDAALPATKRVNGDWKLDVTTAGPPADPAAAAASLRRQAEAAEKAAHAVSSGKVRSADGVRQMLKGACPLPGTDRWKPPVVIPPGTRREHTGTQPGSGDTSCVPVGGGQG